MTELACVIRLFKDFLLEQEKAKKKERKKKIVGLKKKIENYVMEIRTAGKG